MTTTAKPIVKYSKFGQFSRGDQILRLFDDDAKNPATNEATMAVAWLTCASDCVPACDVTWKRRNDSVTISKNDTLPLDRMMAQIGGKTKQEMVYKRYRIYMQMISKRTSEAGFYELMVD